MRKPILASFVLSGLLFLLAIILGNTEFVIYGVVAIALTLIIYFTDNHFHYNIYALWGLAIWIVLHSLGGMAHTFSGVRFYDWVLIDLVGEPYSILKYDQVVHVYTYVVIAGLLCSVVDSIVGAKANPWTIKIVVVLAAIGIGGVNEIIEFLPVVFFNSPGPGGYENTVLDLIANSLGAMLGTFLYYRSQNS